MGFRSTISLVFAVLAAAGCSSERANTIGVAHPRLGAEAREWDGVELRRIRKGRRARSDRRRLVRNRAGRAAHQLGRASLPRPRQGRRDRCRHESASTRTIFVIPLPDAVARRTDIPFKWVLLNWNPLRAHPSGGLRLRAFRRALRDAADRGRVRNRSRALRAGIRPLRPVPAGTKAATAELHAA